MRKTRYFLCVPWEISRSEALSDAPEVLTGALCLESSQLGAAVNRLDPARGLLVAPSMLDLCEGCDGSHAFTYPARPLKHRRTAVSATATLPTCMTGPQSLISAKLRIWLPPVSHVLDVVCPGESIQVCHGAQSSPWRRFS